MVARPFASRILVDASDRRTGCRQLRVKRCGKHRVARSALDGVEPLLERWDRTLCLRVRDGCFVSAPESFSPRATSRTAYTPYMMKYGMASKQTRWLRSPASDSYRSTVSSSRNAAESSASVRSCFFPGTYASMPGRNTRPPIQPRSTPISRLIGLPISMFTPRGPMVRVQCTTARAHRLTPTTRMTGSSA